MSLRNLRNFHLFEEKIRNSFTQKWKIFTQKLQVLLKHDNFHLKGHFLLKKIQSFILNDNFYSKIKFFIEHNIFLLKLSLRIKKLLRNFLYLFGKKIKKLY